MDELDCESAMYAALGSERVSYLMKKINSAIPEDSPKLAVYCSPCDDNGVEGKARAFFGSPPSTIVLCQNRLASQKEVTEALLHESMHAYDFIVRSMDLKQGPMLACSEIRANREGECSKYVTNSIYDAFPKRASEWFRRKCVISAATGATSALYPNNAASLVKDCFEKCYDDDAPFKNL